MKLLKMLALCVGTFTLLGFGLQTVSGAAEKTAQTSALNPQKALSSLAYLGTAENADHGSGFWKNKTQVITAKHVAVTLNFQSVVRDYMSRTYKIVDVDISADDDLAVVTIEGEAHQDVTPVETECSLPALLEPVVAFGHPLKMRNIAAIGHVMGTEQSEFTGNMFRVVANLAVGPGFSGGPVFNANGKVWGVLVAIALATRETSKEDSFNTGLAYVVPLFYANEFCTIKLPEEGKPE